MREDGFISRGGGSRGGGGGVNGIAAWQIAPPRVWRNIVLGGNLQPRLCTIHSARAA